MPHLNRHARAWEALTRYPWSSLDNMVWLLRTHSSQNDQTAPLQDERTQRQVSKWLRSRITVQTNFGACVKSLGAFFDAHRELKAPMKAAKLAMRAPAQQSTFLQVAISHLPGCCCRAFCNCLAHRRTRP